MQTAADKAQTLDEILKGQPPMPPPAPLSKLNGKSKGELIHSADDIKRAIARARNETTEDASSYFLQCLMNGVAILRQGDQLAVGRAIDDALTHFLAGIKAELGPEIAENLAALLIHNVALFLSGARREAVMDAVA